MRKVCKLIFTCVVGMLGSSGVMGQGQGHGNTSPIFHFENLDEELLQAIQIGSQLRALMLPPSQRLPSSPSAPAQPRPSPEEEDIYRLLISGVQQIPQLPQPSSSQQSADTKTPNSGQAIDPSQNEKERSDPQPDAVRQTTCTCPGVKTKTSGEAVALAMARAASQRQSRMMWNLFKLAEQAS